MPAARQQAHHGRQHHLIIIGSGPAGLTAIYAARTGTQPLELESTSTIDNFHGFADGIGAVELLGMLTARART